VRLALALAFVALLAGGATFASDGTGLARGTATLTSKTRQVTLQVELARTPAERERGLMGRRSLAPRAGMVFLYREPTRGAFWMKGTLIPLSAAFYDGRGQILRILRMEPCRSDPCRLYDPGVAYRGVLEVNAGSFGRWGMRAGDRITVRSPSG
jgi:uncharacterized membrane protein (UPF0127 family)